MDWQPDDASVRAEQEAEDYCPRCDRLVPIVRQMTCPTCGEEER